METPQEEDKPYVVPADEVTKTNPLLNVLKDPAKAKKLPPPKPAQPNDSS